MEISVINIEKNFLISAMFVVMAHSFHEIFREPITLDFYPISHKGIPMET